jgi:hypothetical protein
MFHCRFAFTGLALLVAQTPSTPAPADCTAVSIPDQ